MKEKHFFAANNTSYGFYSYFNNIIKPEETNRLYILKGGPGVGKSSFMKKFANHMKEKDYTIEYVHCSSDNDSLDGIVISELNVAILDGTAPHTIDPQIPGVIDEIINLGAFIDSKELEGHKNEIIQINKLKSQAYKSAYRYLASAGFIQDEIDSIYKDITNYPLFYKIQDEIIDTLFLKNTNRHNTPAKKQTLGQIRKLFTEAYTASGYITRTPSYYPYHKTYALFGKDSNIKSALFDRIVTEAVQRGYNTECFYQPLKPDKLQHIIIPELNILVTSTENLEEYKYEKIYDFKQFTNYDKYKSRHLELEQNQHLQDLLIKNALEKLSEAKKHHVLLEDFYVKSMNFKGVDQCYADLMTKYLSS